MGSDSLIGERLATPEEVAEFLAVTPEWVKDQARAGAMPAMKLGRYWRFEMSEVQAWLTSRQDTTYKRRSG